MGAVGGLGGVSGEAIDGHRCNRRSFLAGTLGLAALSAVSREAFARQPAGELAGNERFWRDVRRAFSLDEHLLNLNNGNSSSSPRSVHETFVRAVDETNRLPVHYRGLLEERFEDVRRALAAAVGCDPEELALTRNTTEALHIAQNGIPLRAGDEIVTTDQDYPRMLWAWDQRARRDGVRIVRVQFPVPAAAGDLLDRFERALTPRTKVLHFCHITNVTGQLFPVRELCAMARRRGIVTVVDGAQAVAHFPFAIRDLGCDFYGTSLHKWLMAPQGTGFLYVRRDLIAQTWPLQAAVDSLRGNIRKFEEAGTQGAAARAAIAEALAFHRTIGPERKAERLRALTLRWANGVRSLPRVTMLSNLEPGHTWGLATVGLDRIDAPAVARALFERHRIVVSAVVSQTLPGPVFDFQGLRVTPNIFTSMEDIDRFVHALEDVLERA